MSWSDLDRTLGTPPLVALLLGWLLALLIALVASRLIAGALGRAARHGLIPHGPAEATRRPLTVALLLIASMTVLATAPLELRWLAPLDRALVVALIASLTWLAVRMVRSTGDVLITRYSSPADTPLHARELQTKARVLTRTLSVTVVTIGLSLGLMTFPTVRQIGASLLASAGVLGIVVGLAARPLFGNLLAGLQIALTQPIRLGDAVIVEGEWGTVEEITSTFVIVRIWDDRRMVLPLQWFIDHPFQNWTRTSTQLTGTVQLWVDFRMPIGRLRDELQRICEHAPEWDGRMQLLQVIDAGEHAVQLRAVVTAGDASRAWDLRCRVREELLAFMQREYPQYLPRVRTELSEDGRSEARSPRKTPVPIRWLG